MLIAVIILLSSFPASIKVAGKGGSRGGGGGFVGSGTPTIGIGNGYRGGNFDPPATSTGGYKGGGSTIGSGYLGGNFDAKPKGGGDTGPAIVVIPKKPEEPAPKVAEQMPQECKPEVRDCINAHILGPAGQPMYRGECCVKLKNSVACVCKFLTSQDPSLRRGANDVLRGCQYSKPRCSKMPMPQVCRQEVRGCVNSHIYGFAGKPQYRRSCCQKFKHSKKCVCAFVTSKDNRLSQNANGVIRGCRFTKANCPKI